MNIKNKQYGFAHPVGLGVIALTLVVVGFAGYRVANNNEPNKLASTEQKVKSIDALPLDLNGILEVSKIKELAIGSTLATVSDLELENEHGQLVYKVTLSNGTVVILDANTGLKVISSDIKPEVEDAVDAPDGDDVLPANFTVSISFDKAREIAQTKFPNGTISKIELDVEAGKVVFSVRFADKARVDIDANTGAIVRVKSSKSQASTPAASTSAVNRPSTHSGSSGSSGSDSGLSGSTGGSDSSHSDSSSSNSGSGSSSTDDDDADSSDDSGGSNSGSGSSGSGR